MANGISRLFQGRLSRLYYFLGVLLISLIVGIFTGQSIFRLFLGNFSIAREGAGTVSQLEGAFLIIMAVLWLMMFFSLMIRRIHDLGKNGWLVLLVFIPIVNFFFMLWLFFAKGQIGDNVFGPAPKDEDPFLKTLFGLK